MGLLTTQTVKKFEFQNPRWRTAANMKTVKSPYLRNRLTDFDEVCHGDADWPPTGDTPLKFRFLFKKQDGGDRHLENHTNHYIATTDWQIFTKFGAIVQNRSLNRAGH